MTNCKCINCKNFLKTDPDPKKCSCKVKPHYITQNALINAWCDDFLKTDEYCNFCKNDYDPNDLNQSYYHRSMDCCYT